MPIRCVVTYGITADYAKVRELSKTLIADRAYDSDKIVKNADNLGMKVVIPPQKLEQFCKNTTKSLKIRRLTKNVFLKLKR